ncbi:hypothetical protein HUB97_12025 [Halorubraceae archaeon YAN]|nr:hypothetical protein [Halorubraceae archaeon YAN]
MNLDELRSVQDTERRKDSLQHLRDDFYQEVATYLSDLKSARDRRAEQVENPFSDEEIRRMSDEIETAEDISESLYERRVGKVVKLSSFAAAEMPVDKEGMTTQEYELFVSLVDRIKEHKAEILSVLTGRSSPMETSLETQTDTAEEKPADETSTDGMLADVMGTDAEPTPNHSPSPTANESTAGEIDSSPTSDVDAEQQHTPVSPASAPDGIPPEGPVGGASANGQAAETPSPSTTDSSDSEGAVSEQHTTRSDTVSGEKSDASGTNAKTEIETDRQTVRIKADVGSIFGVDEREYTLKAEDIVQLPAANAKPLVDRDAAELLK